MSSDDIAQRIRENLPCIEWEQPLAAERERLAADEIERLRAEVERTRDYACRMDALAEERLWQATRLRAEVADYRSGVNWCTNCANLMHDNYDKHCEIERLRTAGDALITALDKGTWAADVIPAITAWNEARHG